MKKQKTQFPPQKKQKSLLSSVKEKGDIVDKIIFFSGGNKKTYKGVITDSIVQSEFTRFDLEDNRRVYINTKNVDFFEIINGKEN